MATKTVQPNRAIAPGDDQQDPGDDEQRQPDPVVQGQPGQDDPLTVGDIAGKMTPAPVSQAQASYPEPLSDDERQARAAGNNDQADLIRLMYQRYHQDQGAIASQLAAATGQPAPAAAVPGVPAAAPAAAAYDPNTYISPDEANARARGDNDQADLIHLMQTRYHTDPAQVAAQLAAATGGQVGAADPGAAAGTATTTTTSTSGIPTSASNANLFQQKLAELMSRSTVPSADDPEIAATLNAARLAGQRGYERDRADVAEQLSASGMSDSGAVGSALAGLRANRAATDQQVAASTFTDAANRRISELQDTLKLAGDQMNEDQTRQVQLQIAKLQDATSRANAQLSADTQRAQISEGGRQADADLAEKIREYGLDAAYRAQSLAASGAAGSASNALAQSKLDESTREFNENLQFEKDKWLTQQNSNPVLAWLQQAFADQG